MGPSCSLDIAVHGNRRLSVGLFIIVNDSYDEEIRSIDRSVEPSPVAMVTLSFISDDRAKDDVVLNKGACTEFCGEEDLCCFNVIAVE